MSTGSNYTQYTHGGVVNGKAVHNWHCLTCPWTHTEVGGRKEQNMGQRKADRHACYDSSKDAQKGRKDLEND